MSIGILLAMLASFGWGAGDVFSRKAMYHVSAAAVTLGMVILTVVTLAVVTALAGGLSVLAELPWWVYALTALMGFFAYIGGQFLYLAGMERAGLTIVAPIIAAAPLFAVVMAVTLGGERPSPLNLIGAAVIVAGVILVVTDRNRVVRP